MSEQINLSQLLSEIQASRSEWDTAVARCSESRMLQPGMCGDWSLKDVIAHITWHEGEMIGVLRKRALVGSDWWELPLDQRNQAIYLEYRDLPLQEVLDAAKQVYAELLRELGTLAEEELHDPSHFSGMPADWKPWELFASNTYEHYRDHLVQFQTWLRE